MGRRRISARCPSQRAFYRIRKSELWSKEERQRILIAIYQHGLFDIEALLSAVPGRSLVELRNFLTMRKAEGLFRNRDPRHPAPLDEWLAALGAIDKQRGGLRPNTSRDLFKVMMLIAETEKHPLPEECGGLNFRQLYQYLAFLFAGTHPKMLNIASARFLMNACVWVTGLTIHKDFSEHRDFIRYKSRLAHCSGLGPICNTYSKATPSVPKNEFPVFNEKDINPLNVPDSVLDMKMEDLAAWGKFGYCMPNMNQVCSSK